LDELHLKLEISSILFLKIRAIWHYHPIFLQNFPIGLVQPIFFEAFGPHEAPPKNSGCIDSKCFANGLNFFVKVAIH